MTHREYASLIALQRHYHEIVDEPVPDYFGQLLASLDESPSAFAMRRERGERGDPTREGLVFGTGGRGSLSIATASTQRSHNPLQDAQRIDSPGSSNA